MKQIKAIIIVFLTSILYACPSYDDGHKYINFVNKSSTNLRYQILLGDIVTSEDTIYQCRQIPLHISADTIYLFKNPSHIGSWESHFKGLSYVHLLIMDEDIYMYYANLLNNNVIENCDTIRKYVPILHRYQLTLEDLQRMNWTVVYPPEE